MNADLLLFHKIANRLIYLTTRDEFGSSRSLGIETIDELTDDLNERNIVPTRGYWTKNSLAIFFHRLRKRYSASDLCAGCDFDFVGRHAWEYQSYTRHEDICEPRACGRNKIPETHTLSPMPNAYDGVQKWKEHEMPEVSRHDKKMQNFLKA